MAKSKIDQLLDKEYPSKEDLQFIVDYYSKKPFEELTEHETNYLYITKNLLEVEKNEEPKEEPIVNKKEKALEIIKEKNIDLFEIKHCETLDDYKMCVTLCDYPVGEEDIPTQEQFDLLKEVLK